MAAARPALAVGGAAAVLALGWFLDRPDGPDHPDEWDPRVAELAEFVEDERGLRFEHPVAVDFLTGEEYAERVRGSDDDEPDPDETERLDAQAGLLRALGLAEGEIDLEATAEDVADIGTLAFYDPDTQRVTVRGTTVTPDLRVTLVHELTHAVQDQAYGLDDLFDVEAEAAGIAVRGLIEGDAVRIEEAYVATLPADERAAYDDATDASVEGAEAGLADAPPAYIALFDAPYAFGRPFLAVLDAPGGPTIDDAFEEDDRRPVSEEQLADPARYLDGDEPTEVRVPDPPPDDEVDDEGSVGWFAWFLLLAERLDAHAALAAVDGWDGDAYVASAADGGPLCVTAAVATDSADDRDELAAALDEWAAQHPDATSEVDGDLVVLRACDPGADADLGITGRGPDALVLPVVRSYLLADALTALDLDDASCVVGSALAGFGVDELGDPESTLFSDGRFGEAVEQAFATCGF